jgi:hypothetical protein
VGVRVFFGVVAVGLLVLAAAAGEWAIAAAGVLLAAAAVWPVRRR